MLPADRIRVGCAPMANDTKPHQAKLQIVSGKGGVGKTLVAAALAQRLAAQGEKTLLVSFEQRPIEHPFLGITAAYKPQQMTQRLWLSRVDARQALLEYVRRKVSFSLIYEGMLANPVTQKFLDALPLFDELMCLGKLYDLTTHPDSGFDRVVFDAPATGHCRILLNVPAVASATLAAGPIHHSSQQILSMLRDPALAELVIVTMAEETPVREALELREFAVEEAQIACSTFWVNRFVECHIDEATQHQVRAAATQTPSLAPIAQALDLEQSIAEDQAQQIAKLRAADVALGFVQDSSDTGVDLLTHAIAALQAELK
ncbi:MAG: ArsA-related P-loop ATPase [Pseudomonadales bacterium]